MTFLLVVLPQTDSINCGLSTEVVHCSFSFFLLAGKPGAHLLGPARVGVPRDRRPEGHLPGLCHDGKLLRRAGQARHQPRGPKGRDPRSPRDPRTLPARCYGPPHPACAAHDSWRGVLQGSDHHRRRPRCVLIAPLGFSRVLGYKCKPQAWEKQGPVRNYPLRGEPGVSFVVLSG